MKSLIVTLVVALFLTTQGWCADRHVSFPGSHVRVVSYSLVDVTDDHDELVQVNEWLLGANETELKLTVPIVAVEDLLTGVGRVYLRRAPLPHARKNPLAVDFVIEARQDDAHVRGFTVCDTGYPCVEIPYVGGRDGRIRALQDYQRTVRPYEPGRDGLFLSNTWGDRNRDTRINEAFLLGEIKAGAELGVDVIQVDDGWQLGKSRNSAFADGKGVWNGYWAARSDFWQPDPARFPNGLAAVTKAAAEKGIRFGLWFAPDSSDSAANWERDAEWILHLHRDCGVDYFKLDSMKTTSDLAFNRQIRLFQKVLNDSKGRVVIDMDVTAEKRPGYFGLMEAGPLFVENRYTDFRNYWPHLTLRTLWSLCEVIDPVRLRIEVLNPQRNKELYGGDPLAPTAYPAETLFAVAMPASPLGWFENQGLSSEIVAAWKPLVATWKRERTAMASCYVLPVGAKPDGMSWTGFVFKPRNELAPGYVLLYRELSSSASFEFDLKHYFKGSLNVEILSPRGTIDALGAYVNRPLDFVWAKVTPQKRQSLNGGPSVCDDGSSHPVEADAASRERVEWSEGYSFDVSGKNSKLPRVLIVGDSIAWGYQAKMRELLADKMSVTYWVSSYCLTHPAYRPLLDFYLDSFDYDVIHFNNGLHSLNADVADWEKALSDTLAHIQRRQPKAKLIWATSTPLKDAVRTERVKALNRASLNVASRMGIRVNDLFSAEDRLDREVYWTDMYHHGSSLVAKEARLVAETVGGNREFSAR